MIIGLFSEDEIRDFMHIEPITAEYVPGDFLDVSEISSYKNAKVPNGVRIRIPYIASKLDGNLFDKYKDRLVDVFIPSSVKEIDEETFSNCPNLMSVTLCERTGIKDYSRLFKNCPNLHFLCLVPEEVEKSQGGGKSGTYIDKNRLLMNLKLCRIEHSYSIPEVVESISDLTLADIQKVSSEISGELKEEPEINSNGNRSEID